MPIVIKQADFKVRKPSDGTYNNIDVVSDGLTSEKVAAITAAGTTQVGNVNTAGTTQIAAVNAAGTTQVGNVETAGSTQIAAVNAAGADQIDAVEDKGEEVLASIPDDYTELSEEVSTLNSALEDLNTVLDYQNIVTAEIEQYSINSTTGKNTSSSYTAYYRTGGFYQPTHIKATSTRGTLSTTVYFYAAADVDTFISATSGVDNLDEDITYPQGAAYVRVAGFVRNNPDNPLNLSAVTVLMTLDAEHSHNKINDIETDITKINSKLEAADINNVVASFVDTEEPYNLIPSNITWTANAQISPTDGTVGTYSGRYCSGYIPIDATKQYLWLYVAVIHKEYDVDTGTYTSETIQPFANYQYAFYKEDYSFVASTSETADRVKVIPATAKYIRVTVANQNAIKFARLIYASGVSDNAPTIGQFPYKKIPKEDYQMPLTGFENFKMVCFGDSLTHGDLTGNDNGLSYVDYASQDLNAKLYNVGFGSSCAAKTGESVSGTGLFAFWNLCDCITSSDSNVWDDLDSWAASGNTTYAEHLETLKAIEWNKINAISILYGANDWVSNIPVGDEYSIDTTKYDGAIAYGISKLLTAFPHLQVMILSPFYRERTINNDTITSDEANTAGLTMPDYADSLKNVQKGLHITVVDSGNWNFNSKTIHVLTIDGTHPITDIGKFRLGHLVANAIKANLSPI